MRAKFNRRMTALAVAAALSFSTSVLADTGGLRITIVDNNGNPVAGATVKVRTPDSLTEKEAVSDAEGNVRLVGLDASTKYQVNITGQGYQPLVANNVRVVTGKSLSLSYQVSSENFEKIEVTGKQVAAMDTTSAVVATDITLDLTESLPTARNYQSYLQLAPGVKPSNGGNPSSKSGVNYSDIPDARFGSAGTSSDNVYYIDGVNVTDNSAGTFGANFNSEIIQEQQIITGGIPAKYSGGAGLVSRVVTKSGSNEFHGSINYYMQNDSLVSDYKNDSTREKSFSNFDTAITLGGPIIKDKLWFFASYQLKNEDTDVPDPDNNGAVARSVEREEKLGFAKITWQATDDDRLTFTYFNDPTEISGTDIASTPNNRDRVRKQGGDNYKVDYTHSWDDLILSAGIMSHEGELSDIAVDQTTRNDVAYIGGNPTKAELSRGGLGSNTTRFRNKDNAYINLEYYLYTDFGEHKFEFGYEREKNENYSNQIYTGEGAQYTSIAAAQAGITLDEYIAASWTGEKEFSSGDRARFINAINSSADKDYFVGLLDTDNDGAVSQAEIGAMTFGTTSGNPDSQVNAYRALLSFQAPSEFVTKGQVFYLQDTWTLDNLTVAGGIRAEKWNHYANDGSKIFTFDWEYAPRLSVVYDINGDGESKVWAFSGRYYDPIRTNMTSFAGNVKGNVLDEQVFVGDKWLTYRTRGPADAMFAPSTKTPYTDEFMIGYQQSILDDMSVSFTYTDRKTKDILEDYDLGLYSETGEYAGTFLELPLSYFGFSEVPRTNYVIATLEGGIRKYKGYEVAFRKHKTDNWQMLASYTHNDAEGNTNSDSNADYQGDWSVLDPRAPNQYGKQPGNIDDQFKVAASYFFDNGIEVGAVYNWNSGVRYSETMAIGGRHLPVLVDVPYEFGGWTDTWIKEGAVGSHTTPSFGTLDLRVKYSMDIDIYKAEFFLDIFNALDDQAVTREQDLVAGDGTYQFGEAMNWVEPRRFYLGMKLSF
ncbi:carboxypeptidase regulatory-like domain-containing protein [Bowmanella yangjiangensis]|uniref:TonB-dependent receptor n=1 Tax=Bowmanella yangjiangensis TaxID=2811230 RepID=A0ABS3CSU7_9ALTE|nr:carboxypeptidase regulatory-like domain-containing protein [Bowmanella yangjiangensis]MBN7820189.1 TonB-dependent receptor [Bowmanella yangjiangensis]